MKKASLYSLIAIMVAYSFFVAAKHFWRGETLSTSKTCQRWGEQSFEANKFKSANETDRAQMACSILKSVKTFVGKDRSDIRKELGDHDGFYFSDMFPAYMIETAKERGQDSWQIVFMLNNKQKVSEIIVHKNCCDKK